MDGNFSAEHMKMRRSEDDVRLTNGTGFMVESTRYQEHLSSALDVRQESHFVLLRYTHC
jgi:hypothetical protein